MPIILRNIITSFSESKNYFLPFWCLLILLPSTVLAQVPYIDWQFVYGDLRDEELQDLCELNNGHLVTVGTISEGPGIASYDGLILILDETHQLITEITIGGASSETIYTIAPTDYGGFIVAGISQYTGDGYLPPPYKDTITIHWTNVLSGDIHMDTLHIQHQGQVDAWTAAFNASGEVLWFEHWGGDGDDVIYDISPIKDQLFALAGFTDSETGTVTSGHGRDDQWLLTLNSEIGEIIWQQTYGGTSNEQARALTYDATRDLIIAAGMSSSEDGEVSKNIGSKDYWITQINPYDGSLKKDFSFGGTRPDIATDLLLHEDGRMTIIGDILSSDGDVATNIGGDDWWIIQINAAGEILWQHTFGTTEPDQSYALEWTHDGHIMALGVGLDPPINPPRTLYDVFTVKLHENSGEVIYTEDWGGTQWDFGHDLLLRDSGELIVVGYSDSRDGDVGGKTTTTAMHGADDIWMFAIRETAIGLGETGWMEANDIQLYPNPSSSFIHLDYPSDLGVKEIKIYNTLGQLYYSSKAGLSTIDVGDWETGVYFVALVLEGDFAGEEVFVGEVFVE